VNLFVNRLVHGMSGMCGVGIENFADLKLFL
jgi:hypothetical protein